MNPEHVRVLVARRMQQATELIAVAEQFVQALRDYMLDTGYLPRE